MEVSNTGWGEVEPTDPDKFIAQNVGDTRIAFVLANSAPDDEDPVDNGTHGILHPGGDPLTVVDLDTDGLTMYVRSLGPKAGSLYVS